MQKTRLFAMLAGAAMAAGAASPALAQTDVKLPSTGSSRARRRPTSSPSTRATTRPRASMSRSIAVPARSPASRGSRPAPTRSASSTSTRWLKFQDQNPDKKVQAVLMVYDKPQVVVHREREAGDGVGPCRPASIGLAHGKAMSRFHLRRVDGVSFTENGLPLRVGADSARRRAEHRPSSLRLAMPASSWCNSERPACRRPSTRLDLLVRVLVLEFNQRVDVEEAERVGAGRDPRDCRRPSRDRYSTVTLRPFGLVSSPCRWRRK